MSFDPSLLWIGVDFDGTLSTYYGWDHPDNGQPIPTMVQRVQDWLVTGKKVRIITARVADDRLDREQQVAFVQAWCAKHIGAVLPVSCIKDMYMEALWDDRAVQVKINTGLDATEEAEIKLARAEDEIARLGQVIHSLNLEIENNQ